jgi:pyruvate,orthophosphate dikinase
MPKAYKQLREITTRLEKHYKDVQDFEFTIQDETLFMLQTRSGKRTGYAAVVIATDLVAEKLITPKEAVLLVDPESLSQLLAPGFDPAEWKKIPTVTTGLPASPGAASGQVVFTADHAVEWTQQGKKVVLVRRETVPDDIHGMFVAQGILTATGGMTSHAAVVGRQMGKPSVVGAGGLEIDEAGRRFRVAGQTVKEGDYISFDGLSGEVKIAQVASKPSEILQVVNGGLDASKSSLYRRFKQLLSWADKFRRLGIRANADQPDQAELAHAFGAEGIGLCRTEHMFFQGDRIQAVREMILADDEAGRRRALAKLLPMQKQDFKEILEIMGGLPVTIRTLDPPLHEFLPSREEEILKLAHVMRVPVQTLRDKVKVLQEFNPMLGHRGCRLGISYPEITEMQVRAIFEAACELRREGKNPFPEVMIPLVGSREELRAQRNIVEQTAQATMRFYGVKVRYLVGTMIELPRACLVADEIAQEAEFFSFGTNDLTQTCLGLSRDDAGKFLPSYIMDGLLPQDPFVSIDQDGVGALMRIAVGKGRKTHKRLEIGICGEHGGDPESVRFCHKIGLDYVSCSPFRVPIAKLAAAQAVLGKKP